MPRGDKTGPRGMGKMTGRAAGFCAGNKTAGYENDDLPRRGIGFAHRQGNGVGRGRGRGAGFGNGRKMGYRYGQNENPRAEVTELENRIAKLEESIENIISELKNPK